MDLVAFPASAPTTPQLNKVWVRFLPVYILVLEIMASGAFTQRNMELAIPLQADCAVISKQ